MATKRSPARLAARMRPRALAEFVGQEHLVWERGPLGTGKTSLARLLAREIGAPVSTMSAVMSGLVEVRAMIVAAQDRLALNQRRKLVGATTENPYPVAKVVTARATA